VALIPLVEAALAVMRMSCEKFGVLLSFYTVFLVWGSRDPPPLARVLIVVNSRACDAFQKVGCARVPCPVGCMS